MTLDLFGWAPPEAPPAKPTLEERFETFHASYPHVADEMLRLARARLARGDKFISVKALWEELRMYLAGNGEEFKLNNSFTALYSRLLLAREPALVGVIDVRKRRGER